MLDWLPLVFIALGNVQGPLQCQGADDAVPGLHVAGRTYQPVLTCGGLPILRTVKSPSASKDLSSWLAQRPGGVRVPPVLVATRPSDPVTLEDDWPTPPGNLYAAVLVPLPPEAAAWLATQAAAALVRGVLGQAGPVVVARVTAGEGGAYFGGVRAGGQGDAPFVAGVSALATAHGSIVGLDVHLAATPQQYGPAHAHRHVSLRSLTGRAPSAEDALAAWLPMVAPMR